MERRDFFRSLIAGGATVKEWPERKNHRAHHKNTLIYHGPMSVPVRIVSIIADHPAIKKTTHGHLTSRYAESGWTWLFRCHIPEHRKMIGDIRRQPDGRIRVCCWSAADPLRYTRNSEPAEIMAFADDDHRAAPGIKSLVKIKREVTE